MMALKRLLRKWVGDAAKEEEANMEVPYRLASKRATGDKESDFLHPMHITLYNAMGGRIIKFHSHDDRTDQRNETTYVITSAEDFQASLAKFIAIEALKHNG